MEKALDKSERIKKDVKAYKNDKNLSIRGAAALHGVHHTSVSNHLNKEKKSAPDVYVSYQKLTPIEKNVLVQHLFRAYQSGYPLNIKHLNDCADGLLRNKNVNSTVNYHWHNAFFKRHSGVSAKFSRRIDRQRAKAENPDEFIN